MKMLKKKGQIGNLQGFIMGIVTVTIVLVVGLIVLAELKATQGDDNGSAENATETIIVKLGTVPTWIGIIIVVALAFIVLGFFYGKR